MDGKRPLERKKFHGCCEILENGAQVILMEIITNIIGRQRKTNLSNTSRRSEVQQIVLRRKDLFYHILIY